MDKLSHNKQLHPKKGEKNGACNRIACQKEHNVIFYNNSTRKYYCNTCAMMINSYNPGLCTVIN